MDNSSENADVDKSLFDAEQFLSNFTSLREDCDRLKTENHELQMRVQQLSQDYNQTQIDKQNLERHIQKETLRNKETVWNLKLEIQKSQEERLSWKEKYLDLCIKTSQDTSKDLATIKDAAAVLSKDDKKLTKRGKKKPRKKAKDETPMTSKQNETVEQTEPIEEDQPTNSSNMTDEVSSSTQQQQQQQTNDGSVQQQQQQDEPLSLSTTIPSETSNMPTAEMVTSLDANLNSSAALTQNHVVTTDTAEYYGLQAAPFDLNNQGEQVSGTTTFILQTSDATFCATAVLEDQTRNTFTNPAFSLKPADDTFTNQSAFGENLADSGSESEENTEFNFRCNLCNFTYSDEAGLQKHMKAKHAAKTNLCKQCGKAYSTKSSLAQHVHHYHRHPMAYTCDVCQKKFNRKDFLVKHQKTHSDERTFQCAHCDKQFKTSASLSAHVNGAHNEARRFVCDYCGMRTSWRLSHLEHMKLHTGEPRKSHTKKKKQEQQLEHQLQQQQQLQNSELQRIQSQELSQLVVTPGPGAVVQFITTADG